MENVLYYFKKSFESLKEINRKYGLDEKDIDLYLIDMQNFKIYTPIIGSFSTGKSALLNDVLGTNRRKLLKENITPETAIPTEITYSDRNSIKLVDDDKEYDLSVNDFLSGKYSTKNVKIIKINILDNTFFRDNPNVTIVDMPGFGSGESSHDSAIYGYLHKSLAYAVAFAADDMTLKATMIDILKELNLTEIPVCVVITKMDKPASEFDVAFDKLKNDIKKYLTNKDIKFCKTCVNNSDEDSYQRYGSNEFKEFIENIQKATPEIFENKYKGLLIKEAKNTESYLDNKIKNSSLSENELIEKEEKLNRELENLQNKIATQNESFNSDMDNFDEVIRGAIMMSLQSEMSSFVTMALGQSDINQKVASNVRLAVTRCIKERFEPKLKRHYEKLNNIINSGVLDISGIAYGPISVDLNATGLNKKLTNTFAGIGIGLILGPLGVLVGGLIGYFVGKKKEEEKRQQAKARIESELSERFNTIANSVSLNVKMELMKIIADANTNIDNEVSKRQEVLRKSIEDTRKQKEQEEERKQIELAEMEKDLEFVRGLINGW